MRALREMREMRALRRLPRTSSVRTRLVLHQSRTQPRRRPQLFLRDALDDIDECLQDSKFITSSSLRGFGITLRFNLTHIMQTLVDMQQDIVGYSAQNPTDELR